MGDTKSIQSSEELFGSFGHPSNNPAIRLLVSLEAQRGKRRFVIYRLRQLSLLLRGRVQGRPVPARAPGAEVLRLARVPICEDCRYYSFEACRRWSWPAIVAFATQTRAGMAMVPSHDRIGGAESPQAATVAFGLPFWL